MLTIEIVAKNASVTPADIASVITKEYYFTAWEGAQLAYWSELEDNQDTEDDVENDEAIENEPPKDGPLGLLTFCVLVLKNGFTVTGESACASPENFNKEIGQKIARQNAVEKIWPLLGYLLKEKLSLANCEE